MKISHIKIRRIFDNDTPLKASVSVTFDKQLVIHNINVVCVDGRLFIAMPSEMGSDKQFHDVAHPIQQEFRKYLEEAVLHCYELVLSNPRLCAKILSSQNGWIAEHNTN